MIMEAPVVVNPALFWIALGGAILVALMLLAVFVLALVFQRWSMALGIVGLVALFGFLWIVRADQEHLTFKAPRPTSNEQPSTRIVTESHLAPELPPSRPDDVSPPKTDLVAEADETTVARPAWIELPPRLRSGIYEIVVKSGPWTTPGECQKALEEAEAKAAAEYMDVYISPGAGQLIPLETQYIRTRLQTEEFDETIHASVGVMHQAFARLAFDGAVRDELRARWRRSIASERLWYVGGAAAATLLVIGSAFSYLVASNRRAARMAGMAGTTRSA